MPERYDLVIVGMGSGGIVAAEFAAGLGVRVAVVERARFGGDCLWTGCVPSKALLASARAAHTMRTAHRFGLTPVEPEVDLELVWKRLRAVQADIAATDDDPERFSAMGVDVVEGTARFTSATTLAVESAGGETGIEARFVLVCTGSRPAVPDVRGLTEAGFLTSESLFEGDGPPARLVILGGGPTGVELAQACARLGIPTALLERQATLLPGDEPELVTILQRVLVDEGVDVCLDVDVDEIAKESGSTVVRATVGGEARTWETDGVLVATGRVPNVEDLDLDAAGIDTNDAGIAVDDRMRTSVPNVYAAGDVAGRHLSTHAAAYEAVRAVRDMFLPGRGRANDPVPWCTFTDPELAGTGMTIAEAEARHGDDVEVWRQDLVHSDRARTDAATDGAIIVVTHKNRILGAHVLAPGAGELIHELALAIREGVSLSSLGGLIHVYPTMSTGIHQLGGEAAFEKAESFRWLVKKAKR